MYISNVCRSDLMKLQQSRYCTMFWREHAILIYSCRIKISVIVRTLKAKDDMQTPCNKVTHRNTGTVKSSVKIMCKKSAILRPTYSTCSTPRMGITKDGANRGQGSYILYCVPDSHLNVLEEKGHVGAEKRTVYCTCPPCAAYQNHASYSFK